MALDFYILSWFRGQKTKPRYSPIWGILVDTHVKLNSPKYSILRIRVNKNNLSPLEKGREEEILPSQTLILSGEKKQAQKTPLRIKKHKLRLTHNT